jgi:DNA-binding MarR family transcriptional regulator
MAEAGLVRREASPEDRRASYVVMTPQGRDALDRASPGHVRGIVQHFTRYLDSGDVSGLQRFFSRVLQGESGNGRQTGD